MFSTLIVVPPGGQNTQLLSRGDLTNQMAQINNKIAALMLSAASWATRCAIACGGLGKIPNCQVGRQGYCPIRQRMGELEKKEFQYTPGVAAADAANH
jgi:hypothetical protein